MPPRARSPLPKQFQQYYPAADSATFKDLLLFEERLKRNAGLLKKRKARYQLYLAVLVGTILVLTSDVLLETELFEFPSNTALFYYTSYRYPHLLTDDYPHPKFSQYIKTCALFVLGMTLFLFFASGMYSEKVGYANKYVPHANKALRSFNMYLNVRTQPLPSRLSRMATSLGLTFFATAAQPPPTAPPSPTTAVTAIPQRMRTRSLSPSFSSSSRESGSGGHAGSATEIIPPIPPSTNPRGELIFSSRVHAPFREQYERYRENYERKRSMGINASNSGAGKSSFLAKIRIPFWRENSSVDTPGAITPPPLGVGDGGTSTPGGLGSPGALRGRTNTLSSTPSASRRSSPAPGVGGTTGRKGSKRNRGAGKISRQGTPLLEIVEGLRGDGSQILDRAGDGGGALTAEPGQSGDDGRLIEVPSLGEEGSPYRRRSGRGRGGELRTDD
ncbi:hypothetical protein M408DRAFT_329602 [Serendipita vermifera MAFF 305830]|uniref:Transmembrane protein 188 n=1 Tax=Serendipita vermifera MAFF 305830 TaxID=933852 RepID=A0A0C3AUL6_SERVB|nr:hypothetical protein M408DRAFT_329602 [Serendipita vermifera MAFF 305830]